MESDKISAILIGGNHLASSLIAANCFPSEQRSYEQVLADFGQPCADMWICWKAIMDARSVLVQLLAVRAI